MHRLGRKARAGQEGHGIIVLAPFESRFLQTLTRTLPIVPLTLPAGSSSATGARLPGRAAKGKLRALAIAAVRELLQI